MSKIPARMLGHSLVHVIADTGNVRSPVSLIDQVGAWLTRVVRTCIGP